MGEEIFRWVVGLLVGLATPILAWIGIRVNDVDKRLAVLENRRQVDPIEYTKAIVEMSAALASLSAKLAENMLERKAQFEQIQSAHSLLTQRLDRVIVDLDRIAAEKKGITR